MADQPRHPAGRGPYSNAEVVTLIAKATGQEFSRTTIYDGRQRQIAGEMATLTPTIRQIFKRLDPGLVQVHLGSSATSGGYPGAPGPWHPPRLGRLGTEPGT